MLCVYVARALSLLGKGVMMGELAQYESREFFAGTFVHVHTVYSSLALSFCNVAPNVESSRLWNVAQRTHSTSKRRPWQRCDSRGLHKPNDAIQRATFGFLFHHHHQHSANRQFSPTQTRDHLPNPASLVHCNSKLTGRRILSQLRSRIPNVRNAVRTRFAFDPPL